MECKIIDINDVELLEKFKDDQNTIYKKEDILSFINEKNSYGFVIKDENKIVGFAYGYVLLRPDGKKDFYMHAIDILEASQGKGYGTQLMNYIKNYVLTIINCRKMFLITNKSNLFACKCYEKTGGINNADDEIIYNYK